MFTRCFARSSLTAAMLLAVSLSSHAESFINYDAANLLAGRDATQRFHSRFAFGGSVTPAPYSGIGAGDKDEVRVDRLAWFTDWHPWRGGFHVSGGVLVQESASGRSTVDQPADHTRKFSTTSLLDHSDDGVTSYIGLGWSKSLTQTGRLGLNLDLGVLYGGAGYPESSSYRAGALPVGGRAFEDLAPLNLSPVFSFGLSYAF